MKCLSHPSECSLLRFILISSSLGKGRAVNNNDQTLPHKASAKLQMQTKLVICCNIFPALSFYLVHLN